MSTTNKIQQARWNAKTAPAGERFVTVKAANNGQEQLVWKDFPLSLLLTYSKRAKNKLGQHEKDGPSRITWDIDIKEVHNVLEAGGIVQLFKWFLQLPAKGYSKAYAGKPQFPGEMLQDKDKKPLGLTKLLHIYKAVYDLDLEAPLRDQRKLRATIKEGIHREPLSDD
jgi:hypothetical protein